MTQGKIILIEGTDCSGKETQTNLLLEKLVKNNILCKKMSFPRYNTPTGRIIGQCYLGKKNLGKGDVGWFGDASNLDAKAACLYYAADRFVASQEIKNIINSGKHLILDRYAESNMAHQGGKEKDMNKRIKLINFVNNLEYNLLNLPKPDSIIFLYMPYQVSMELKKEHNEEADLHESDINHIKNAEETYLMLSEKRGWTKIECAPDKTKNSLKTPEEISKEVYDSIIKIL